MRFRFAFVSMLVISAMLWAPLVSAQVDNYTSDAFGREITWDDSWAELDTVSSEPVLDDGVQLSHADSGSDVFVGFVATDQDIVEVRDAFVDSAEREVDSVSVIEQGTYNNVSYRVDLLREEGEDAEGVYTVQIADDATGSSVSYVLIAEVASFSNGVNGVQSGITIDGEGALNGVDPAGMQSFLELAQSASSQTGTTEPLEVPAAPEPETESEPAAPDVPVDSGTTTYTSPAWGYTVEYDSAFIDITEPGTELMVASYSPVMVVGFMGVENPGAPTSVIYDALMPTFVDTLGPGGYFVDGGYFENSVVWAGITSDGMQMMQQIHIVSPTTAVIVTILGEPGVNMSTVGSIRLNGVSVLGN